jgi:hypothetical protein
MIDDNIRNGQFPCFPHHCPNSIFLGWCCASGRHYDLYFRVKDSMVMARYGPYRDDYTVEWPTRYLGYSFFHSSHTALSVAIRKAEELGLYKELRP